MAVAEDLTSVFIDVGFSARSAINRLAFRRKDSSCEVVYSATAFGVDLATVALPMDVYFSDYFHF